MDQHEMSQRQHSIAARIEATRRMILLRASLAHKAALAVDPVDQRLLRRARWLLSKFRIVAHIEARAWQRLYHQWKHDGCRCR